MNTNQDRNRMLGEDDSRVADAQARESEHGEGQDAGELPASAASGGVTAARLRAVDDGAAVGLTAAEMSPAEAVRRGDEQAEPLPEEMLVPEEAAQALGQMFAETALDVAPQDGGRLRDGAPLEDGPGDGGLRDAGSAVAVLSGATPESAADDGAEREQKAGASVSAGVVAPSEEGGDDAPPGRGAEVHRGDPVAERLGGLSREPGDEAARAAYWARVLTGDLSEVPADVVERAGANDAALDEEASAYRLASVINRSWVADHSGLSRDQVRSRWGSLRSMLASQLGAADDEQEVFRAISLRASEEKLRAQARDVYRRAYQAGLEGTADDAGLSRFDGVDAETARRLRQVELQAAMDGGALRDRFLPLAEKVSAGLGAVYATENQAFSAPEVLGSAPEVLMAVDELAALPAEDRRVVYYLARGLAPQLPEDESLLSRTVRSVRRGALGLSFGAAQAVGNVAASVVGNLGEQLDGALGTDMRGTADAMDRRLRVLEEMRRVAQDEVYSLEPGPGESRAEQFLVDAAGATPAAVAAFCGGAGFAGLTLHGVGEAIAEARQRAPQGDQQLQTAAGVIAGTLQAGIFSSMSKLGGKAMEQSIAAFARARGGGVGGYSMAALRSLGMLTGESAGLLLGGKAAQAADLGMQELAARVDRTASNIDWQAFGDNLTDVEANMREAAMMLPFFLIGSGRVALRHFRSPGMVLGDGGALREWGISEERCEAIMKESNPDAQGAMLRDALRNSARWGGAGFMDEAMRAMRLLNTDYFKGFSQPEVVRDFLRLPSESAALPRGQELMRPDDPESVSRVLQRPGAGTIKSHSRLASVLPLWDEWWAKSHLLGGGEESSRALRVQWLRNSWERRVRYAKDMEHPEQLAPQYRDAVGAQVRLAEKERRMMVQDRFAEILDLSYQHLLNVYSLDSLIRVNSSPERLRMNTEQSRHVMLGEAAKLLMRMAAGENRSEILRAFERGWGDMLVRRRKRAFAPVWMDRVPGRMLSAMDEYVERARKVGLDDVPPEYLQSMRVMQGVESCAAMLYELLPQTEDFRTALSRGMTPLQAYSHLAARELQIDPGKIPGYPQEAVFQGADSGRMLDYSRRNGECFDLYRKLTGRDVERTVGADGVTYWRARRADGQYTRWHEKPEYAVNDVASSASLSFMEYGASLRRLLQDYAARGDFDFCSWLPVQQDGFTVYDRLCRKATEDMSRYWLGSALRMQPGMDVTQVSKQFASTQGTDGVTPLMQPADRAGGTYRVDQHSVVTPLSLMQARFMTYWRRCLSSGSLDASEAGRMLVERGYLQPREWENLQNVLGRPMRLRRHQSAQDVLAARRELCNVSLARALTDLSTHYVLAQGDRLALPESAREWLSLAVFCPLEAENHEFFREGNRRFRVPLGAGMSQLMRWANRRSMNKIRAYAGQLENFRQQPPLDERMQWHLDASVGQNEAVMLEQAWSLSKLRDPRQFAAHQVYWDLLQEPAAAWNRLSEGQKDDLRRTMSAAAARSGLPEVMEAQAQQSGADLVHELILNLDGVLREHPELHRYALRSDDLGVVYEMRLGEPSPGDVPRLPDPAREKLNLRGSRPFAMEPWYGRVRDEFVVGDMQPLPEFMRGDERVLTALRTLDQLRSFVVDQPYATEDGIWMHNRLYGGKRGARPEGIPASWVQDQPLTGVLNVLERVDELIRDQGTESVKLCGVEMRPSAGLIDGLPWRTVTVYRDPSQAEMIYRLMPGDAYAASGTMRSPYVIVCWNGMYLKVPKREAVREPGEVSEAMNPLRDFHVFERRPYNQKTMGQLALRGVEYTLDGIAERAEIGARRPDSAFDLGYRELLMRFCEDTGFSWSVRQKQPEQLDAGECLALGIARELMLCCSGTDPLAPGRLHELMSLVRDNPEMHQTLLNTLLRGNEAFTRERLRRRSSHELQGKAEVEQALLSAVADRVRGDGEQEPAADAASGDGLLPGESPDDE